ncbi:MAG: methylenetetrahydrofolate reductase [Bdellovibrionales bacterium]
MGISLEFFPPKTQEGLETFEQVVAYCAEKVQPDFASLTFGAGGSSANLPLSLKAIACMAKQGLTVAAHLPHAGRTIQETKTILQEFITAGAKMVVALRGDLPNGQRFVPTANRYEQTSHFVEDIRLTYPKMPIWVAGYPEKHPESPTIGKDRQNLKNKIDAGATGILGQFCFNANQVCKRHEHWINGGIHAEFRPGIIVLANPRRVFEMAEICHTKIPPNIQAAFTPTAAPLPQALAIMTQQINVLSNYGYNVHIYALNNMQVMKMLAEMRLG